MLILHSYLVDQREEYMPDPKEITSAFPTENRTERLKTSTQLSLTIQPSILGNGIINVFWTHDWALARAGETLPAPTWLSSIHLNMAVTSGPRAKGVSVSLGQANSKLGLNGRIAKSFQMDCAQKQASSHRAHCLLQADQASGYGSLWYSRPLKEKQLSTHTVDRYASTTTLIPG